MTRSIGLALLLAACAPPPTPPPPPSCTASTCAGCCDGRGQCQEGSSIAACGRLGLACSACDNGQACVAGLCQGTVLGGGSAGGTSTAGGDAGGTSGGLATGGGAAGGGAAGGSAGGITSGGAAGGMGGGSAGGVTGGGQAGPARRFRTTPTRFAVPGPAYSQARGGSGGATLNWATLDLTGDGRIDLVVTSDALGNPIVAPAGSGVWNVFAGSSTGFAAQPAAFLIPGAGGTGSSYTVTESTAAPQVWSTIDVTGDRLPDLVQTMNPGSPVGGPYFSGSGTTTDGWLVRVGGRGGFSSNGTTFTVPRVPTLPIGIDRVRSNVALRRWGMAFINLDLVPDLVITADPATDLVWQTLGQQWVVCFGTATGFGDFTRCPRLPVPQSGSMGGFNRTTAAVPNAGEVWDLVDMNGDGRDDLVQTMNPLTPGVPFLQGAQPSWRVWLNQNIASLTLFAQLPLNWTVPATTYATPNNAGAPQFWTMTDLDGDGVQDLVVTTGPNTGQPFVDNGALAWHVHLGDSQRGFSSAFTSWPIPRGPGTDGFRSTSGPQWGLMDLTFDGIPDLVQFQDPNTRTAFTDPNGSYWNVYPATP